MKDMTTSFIDTKSSGATKMIVYLNEDDPELPKYQIPKHPDIWSVIGPRRYIAEVYNHYSSLVTADYYSNLNDDHFFATPKWDEKLVALCEEKGNGWGIACADDLLTDWSKHPHPSGCVISGKMTRVLGWISPPGVRHSGMDIIQGKICLAIGCFFGDKSIIIEHRHWVNGMRAFDDNYRWVYSKEEQNYGDRAVRAYLYGQFNKDVAKLKAVIAAEKK